MAMTMTEDIGTTLQKGLYEWWNEETEYVFQRIERWAAFARGYNRLRSQRLSRGRLTMQEQQESRWNVSANKFVIEDPSWNPRFHTLKRSRRKCRAEETKINCCDTFSYQSNSNLDSTCLETYRYDHSIYFKTIGDIRNSKKSARDKNDNEMEEEEQKEERVSISSDELVEWDLNSMSDFIASHFTEEERNHEDTRNSLNALYVPDRDLERVGSSAWPIVDLAKLNINLTVSGDATVQYEGNGNDATVRHVENRYNAAVVQQDEDENNDTRVEGNEPKKSPKILIQVNCIDPKDPNNRVGQKGHESIERFLSFRRTRRISRRVKQPPVVGDNNVIWPGVLLNYTKNIDPATAPHRHHHCATQK